MSKLQAAAAFGSALAKVTARRLRRGPARPSWSVAFEVFVTFLKTTAARINALPEDQQAAAWLAISRFNRLPVRREEVTAGGLPAWWVTPEKEPVRGTLLYLHGGWYSSLELRNFQELLGRLAIAGRVRVLAIEYRKAPQHPFPAAVDDALAAWRWLAESSPPARTIVAGDSAGGALAVALMMSLRDRGPKAELPAGAVLLSPWVDLSASGGSLASNQPFDWGEEPEVHRRARLYAKDDELRHPLVSPAYGDLSGLPPMLVQVGSAEMLFDQVEQLAARAREAGVDVELDVAPDMIHDWQLFAGFFPQSRAAIDRIGSFVGKRLP